MSRSFEGRAESTAGVDQIYAAFGRKDYWLARLEGDANTTLDALSTDNAGTVTVQLTQHLSGRLLPGTLAKFVPADVTMTYTETWTPQDDVLVTGRMTALVSAGLGSCEGTTRLSSTGSGSLMSYRGRVDAKIPLVGGQLEKIISANLSENIPAVLRFTTTWIAEQA